MITRRKYQITARSIMNTVRYFFFGMIKYLDSHLSNFVVWKISSFEKNEKNKGQNKIKRAYNKPFSEKLKYHLT